MGRHSKPSTKSSTASRLAAVATSGAFAAVPMTQGSAQAVSAVQTDGPPNGWDAVIACESGGDPRIVNSQSTASGLFQFLDSTWRTLGGTTFGRRARDASIEQQTEIANRAYARSGLNPWQASKRCWSRRVHFVRRRPLTQPVTVGRPARTYVVRAGDTLSEIAVSHGHRWEDLLAENRAVIADPNLIHVGITIRL